MDYIYSRAKQIVEHPWFFNGVLTLILLNAIIIGLETYPSIYVPNKELFMNIDRFFLWAFTLEILTRFIATKPKRGFLKDGWNLFDTIIVASGHLFVGAHFISVLRILRVLRVLRAISVIPSLQRLVTALIRTIPSLGNIMFLMGIIFYVFAIIGTILFKEISPEYFGSLHTTLLTLFQVVTLESWASAVMRPILEEASWGWIYFVMFVLIGAFVVVNLFVGVIVNNVQEAGLKIESADEVASTASELASLRQEIAQLKSIMISLQKDTQSTCSSSINNNREE